MIYSLLCPNYFYSNGDLDGINYILEFENNGNY